MSESIVDPLTVYCPACNEAFLGRMGQAVCPRCGMALDSDDNASMQTMLIRATESWDSQGAAGPATRDDLHELVGREIDRYTIDSFIGKGGMGWVFLARHLQLGRACAVKFLAPSLVKKDPDYLERFSTEGQAAASLNHPNTVTVHAIGQHEDLHFLEMEFVPGRSLHRVVIEQSLSPVRAASVGLGIANGLSAAHRVGIIHRDLKPDNILLTHHGIPKIGDFGLAKRIRGSATQGASHLAGTPHFMAPELFAGEEPTPASDVYALGVTLFFCLAGQLPFTRRDLNALISAVSDQPPPNLRVLRLDVPLEFCECIALMMEKCPQNRPRDGIEASQLLQAVLGYTRDLEVLMHEAFDHELHVQWGHIGHRYQATVMLPDGRKQVVYVEDIGHHFSDRVLQIFSVCCRAEPDYFEEALRLNSLISHGAIALREVDGEECFVTLNNYPRGGVSAEEIRRSVWEVAIRGDALEAQLTGEDCN